MTSSALGRDTDLRFGPTEWSMSALVALTWGSSFLFIAIAIDHVATGVVPLARLAFGAAALACFPAARRRIERSDLKKIALLGFVAMTIPFYLYPLAEQSVSSSITGMINGSIPITTFCPSGAASSNSRKFSANTRTASASAFFFDSNLASVSMLLLSSRL
jgi:hypothetical protein